MINNAYVAALTGDSALAAKNKTQARSTSGSDVRAGQNGSGNLNQLQQSAEGILAARARINDAGTDNTLRQPFKDENGAITKDRRPQPAPATYSTAATVKDINNLNYLPSPDTLETLISNAKFEQRQGHTLDRGSIVNLIV